jgi:hypothetical protein
MTAAGVQRAVNQAANSTGYGAGEVVDLPGDWFKDNDWTLVLFLRSDCAASQALVSRLPHLRQVLPDDVRLLAIVSDTAPETETRFAEAAGFEPSSVRAATFQMLKLRVVPSMLLIDRNGRVETQSVATSAGLEQSGFLAVLPRIVAGL